MQHDISPLITQGLFGLGGAVVTGIFGLFSGEHFGKKKGRIEGEEKVHADFVHALESAASTIISELKVQIEKSQAHEAECVEKLATVEAQIARLMSLGVPPYRPDEMRNVEGGT